MDNYIYPLDFIVDYAKALNAYEIAFFEYKIGPGLQVDDDGEYCHLEDSEPQHWVKPEAAHKFFIDWTLQNKDLELGICSIIDLEPGGSGSFYSCKHLLLADCDTADIREVKYDLPDWRYAKTDKGYHAYYRGYVNNIEDFVDRFKKVKCIDPKWLDVSRKREFAVLRLTNNTKKVMPTFVK